MSGLALTYDISITLHRVQDPNPIARSNLISGDRNICFSATASFTASFALFTIGAVTVRRAHRSELPYAAIPIFCYPAIDRRKLVACLTGPIFVGAHFDHGLSCFRKHIVANLRTGRDLDD